MAAFFRLVSVHGQQVCLDTRQSVLVTARNPASEATMGLVACRLAARPNILFLTAEADPPVRFYCHPNAELKATVMLLRISGDATVTLSHPFSGVFMTAVPLGAADRAPLHATGESVNAWECFTQLPIDQDAVSRGASSRWAAIDRLLQHDLEPAVIFDLIEADEASADTLNAVLPLIPTATIDRIGQQLMADEAKRTRLRRVFATDLWAERALPELASWLSDNKIALGLGEPRPAEPPGNSSRFSAWWTTRRRREPVHRERPAEPATRRRIGPEFDSLGTSGLAGAFTSLPNACTLRARRQVKPTKGTAMLATARNEGIYLLEWIAHHRLLGVEAFFIYSNDNDDGSDALLGALADAGVITWIDSRLQSPMSNAQFKAYGHALGALPDLLAYHWVLIVDLDEFLVLNRTMFPTLSSFSDWHAQRGADTIAINWQFLRSEETPVGSTMPLTHRNHRLLTEAEMGPGIRLVKSMSRPDRICHSEAHVPFSDERSGLVGYHAAGREHSWHNPPSGFRPSPKFADQVMTDAAVVYHYIFKSAEEWLWKNARNRGDHRLIGNDRIEPMSAQQARSFLSQHGRGALQKTRRAIDCAPDLVAEIKRLRQLPRIDDLHLDVHKRYQEKLAVLRRLYATSPEVAAWDDDVKAFLKLAAIA